MTEQIKIVSYFSIPTDLAAEMRNWQEFVNGEGYDIDLKSDETGETVSVRYFENEGDLDFVLIKTDLPSDLYDRVVGRVICALSMHSDNLMVYR
jgi:hypothetical protein